MSIVAEHAATVGIALFTLCAALGLSRASLYRRRIERPASLPRRSNRALPPEERLAVRDLLNEERFADQSPAEVWATRLDEGHYDCSERTMYRILAEHQEVRERRDQLRHPRYAAPELLATGPNQLWSWDITKLRGPEKGVYFHLYVILDVYSRYVVGWMVAEKESATLAERLIAETCRRQGIERGQLTIHADRGSSMKSKAVALLLVDLGVIRSHSRPHVSDDNPFSEAHFKTLKYRPTFPDRFGSLVDARAFCCSFFAWYNLEHHHSGIALHTPHDVHHGLATACAARRGDVLAAAFLAHPERFPHGLPKPPQLSAAVWINMPHSTAPPLKSQPQSFTPLLKAGLEEVAPGDSTEASSH